MELGQAVSMDQVSGTAQNGKRPRAVLPPSALLTMNSDISTNCSIGNEGVVNTDVLHDVASMTTLAISDEPSQKIRKMEADEAHKKDHRTLAPQLTDYLAPNGTLQYRPRPEWCCRSISILLDHDEDENKQGDDTNNENETEQAGRSMSAPQNGLLPAASFRDFPPSNMPAAGTATTLDAEGLPYRDEDNQSSDTSGRINDDTDNNPNGLQTLGDTSSDGLPSRNRIHAVKSLIRPSTFGKDFDCALHVAIRESATPAALELLAAGERIDVENAKGVTPLILAAQKGNLVVVKELLRRGASAGATTVTGTTAILQAAHFGHLQIIRVILHAGGARLVELANYNHTTPLMRAAQEGHTRVVRYLLSKGALVNRRNRVHMTALMLASQRGHSDTVKALIEYGADLDAMTEQNSTSLLLACKRSHLGVVRALVTAGCELCVRDQRGRTAREAADRRSLKEMANLLDPLIQIDMMRQEARQKRSWSLVRMWTLLQQDRARIPFERHSSNGSIHQLLTATEGSNLPSHLSQSSTQALIWTMALPGPLIQAVAQYAPIPSIWDKRIALLTKQCLVDADTAVMSGLDLVDEILEEGGFLEACDAAQVVPPSNFTSWGEWKAWCRRNAMVMPSPPPSRVRPNATLAMVQDPRDPAHPTLVEARRKVGYLPLLCRFQFALSHVLSSQPYNMPAILVQQLITINDIQSLVRRMGSRGVHFEPSVAMDIVMLSSRLCSWYNRERDDL